jgi:hypothetical protein
MGKLWKITIDIVDFPIENGWIFPVRYVSTFTRPGHGDVLAVSW